MRANVPDRQCSFALPAAAAEMGGEWEGTSCREDFGCSSSEHM